MCTLSLETQAKNPARQNIPTVTTCLVPSLTASLVPVTDITPPREGEKLEELSVRFRTVGDISCTCPVESAAATAAEIIAETVLTTVTERGATRMDDQTSEASMERRKKEGYF